MKKLLLIAIAVLFVAPMAMSTDWAVDIQDNQFVPASLPIVMGDTVTWTNSGSATHTVTSLSNEFVSGDLGNGGTFIHVFDTLGGVFAYECTYHEGMDGTIHVIPPVYGLPTMTIYGLGILALLLIGSTVWVLRRRRAGAVA